MDEAPAYWLADVARRAAGDAAPELARYRVTGPPAGRPASVLVAVADHGSGQPRAAGPGPANGPAPATAPGQPPGHAPGHAPGAAGRSAASRPAAAGPAAAGADAGGAAVLLVQRSDRLRKHPAEITFPGGSLAAGEDAGAAALREAREEAGLDPGGVRLVGTLPQLHLAWTGFLVTPVLAHWPGRAPVPVPDGAEVTLAGWVPLAGLADPAHRFALRYPTGYIAPAFLVAGLLIWGFTGSLLGWLLRLAGHERGWDTDRVEDLAPALARYGGGFGR